MSTPLKTAKVSEGNRSSPDIVPLGRPTINIPRTEKELAGWSGPVGFTDLDLHKYNMLLTRVYGRCRLTVFAKRDKHAAYLLAEGETEDVPQEKWEGFLKLALVPCNAAAVERISNYMAKGGKLDGRSCAILVARGVRPVNGADGRIEWHCKVPEDHGAGKEREDGSVDYRERMTFVHARANEHLLTLIPPTRGTNGVDYQGKVLPAKDGAWVRPKAGRNVKYRGKDELELFSTADGVLDIEDGFIHIRKQLTVEKVDFSTGNIHYSGDVRVLDSANANFLVEAEGVVNINGDVHQATVRGEHVHVGGRVISSAIVSGGNVVLKWFVERGSVRANSRVKVLGDVVGTSIDCGGPLVMPDGRLVAAKVRAIGGGSFGWLGGKEGEPAEIVVGLEDCALPCLDEVSAKIGELEADIAKLNVRLAPIQASGAAAISEMAAHQRESYKKLKAQVKAYEDKLAEFKERKVELLKPYRSKLKPVVKVAEGISAGVKIVLLGKEWMADRTLAGRHVIGLSEDGVEVVVRAE